MKTELTLAYKSQKKLPVLPNPTKAIAFSLGALLGDGSLKATEYRMCIEQADLGYAQWKKRVAVELGLATERSKISVTKRTRTDRKTGKVTNTTAYRFYSLSLYSTWHGFFYVFKSQADPTFDPKAKPQRRKRFPKELVDWFNHPLALAVFYMDDGGVQDNQPYLATGEVPLDEVLNLQKALDENFGLETTLRYDKGVVVGLLVRRRSCAAFFHLVKDYVLDVPSMRYKLDFD